MSMTAAETARKALEILDKDGWAKNWLTVPPFSFSQEAGAHCIMGAWNIAHHQYDSWQENLEYVRELRNTIAALYPDQAPDSSLPETWWITAWNNDPETTLDDVRAVLEKIAAD